MAQTTAPSLPQRLHVYENHHLDSPRWDRFETRPGDILITTAYKSGTTWMQTIVAHLLFQGTDIPGAIMDISPWIDMRGRDFDEIQNVTSTQTHRRFLKTHLALDGLPYKEDMQYIYVGRDLRDVFMSLWNHYSGHTDFAFEQLNHPDRLVGEPFPRPPDDIRTLWKEWVSRGWFPWEQEGWPYFSASHHAQTWWDYRHLDNLLFVHFADLLAQPAVEIQRIADFLGIPVTADSLDRIVEAVSFKSMKQNSDAVVGAAAGFWEGGSKRFVNKGTNGRWREVLSDDDLLAYHAMVEKALSKECARWLEEGRAALAGAANP
jgi:aryl sulfotransferase